MNPDGYEFTHTTVKFVFDFFLHLKGFLIVLYFALRNLSKINSSNKRFKIESFIKAQLYRFYENVCRPVSFKRTK